MIYLLLLAWPKSNQKVKADADGLLRDLRSLSHPNSLRSDRDAPHARYGLFAWRPSAEAVRRKAKLSSYISRDIIIHYSLFTINY